MKLEFGFLKKIIGKTILRIERLFYQTKDVIDREKGAIQLSFDDETVLFFDVDADTETLLIKSEKWIDPFGEPLSIENKDYVETFGKWEIYDVSDDHAYRDLLNKRILTVRPIKNNSNTIVGVVLDVEGILVNLMTGADFLWVMFGDVNNKLQGRELSIGEDLKLNMQ